MVSQGKGQNMGHFSVEIYAPPGSTLSGNQHCVGSAINSRTDPQRNFGNNFKNDMKRLNFQPLKAGKGVRHIRSTLLLRPPK